MNNQKHDTQHIDAVHHYLALQESVEEKINQHTKKLRTAATMCQTLERKVQQIPSFKVALASLFLLVFALLVWLAYLFVGIGAFVVIPLGVYGIYHFIHQRFAQYKNFLEQQIIFSKNNVEQFKKNIENRVHELHDIQQRLQLLWSQKP